MNKLVQCFLFALVFILVSANVQAQLSKEDKKKIKAERKANDTEIEATLKAYTTCRFEGDMKIAKVDRTQKKDIFFASRYTAKSIDDNKVIADKLKAKENSAEENKKNQMVVADDGKVSEGVSRTDGYRVMIDQGKPDFFANIRVDKSIPEFYEEDKKVLVRWIEFYNQRYQDPETKFPQETYYNGFETSSINQSSIEVAEIGITIFFDNKNKTITTLYLLGQRPENRSYKNLDEWKVLRNDLLKTYTSCVKENLDNTKTP